MLDSIYHMTLKIMKIAPLGLYCQYYDILRNITMDVYE